MNEYIYYIIFVNSFKASIIASFYSENAWYAALQFGTAAIVPATIMAICGSFAGMAVNFFLGHYFSTKRGDWFVFRESLYQRISRYNERAMYLLLVPFQSIPFIGLFWSFLLVGLGFFRARPKKCMILLFAGRIVYYLGYLLIFKFTRFG